MRDYEREMRLHRRLEWLGYVLVATGIIVGFLFL